MNNSKTGSECQTVDVYFDVYVIWCRITDMNYVGVTGQKVATRIRQHKRGKQFVDKEIQRVGWEGNWDYWVVEENVPSDIITEREQYWVDFFHSVYPYGYNKTIGGIKHFKHSKKTCEKMSESHLDKKPPPFTEEHRANIAKSKTGEKNPNFGRPAWNSGVPCPESTKKKISQKLTGRKRPDQSERMKGEKNPNFGREFSEEHRAKISSSKRGKPAWNKGIPRPEQTKAKISESTCGRPAWNRGIPCSEEQKAKLREQALERDISGENNPFYGKHHTPEAIEKNRQAHLGRPSWNKGKPMPEKTKALLREKALAKAVAEENLAAANSTPISLSTLNDAVILQ